MKLSKLFTVVGAVAVPCAAFCADKDLLKSVQLANNIQSVTTMTSVSQKCDSTKRTPAGGSSASQERISAGYKNFCMSTDWGNDTSATLERKDDKLVISFRSSSGQLTTMRNGVVNSDTKVVTVTIPIQACETENETLSCLGPDGGDPRTALPAANVEIRQRNQPMVSFDYSGDYKLTLSKTNSLSPGVNELGHSVEFRLPYNLQTAKSEKRDLIYFVSHGHCHK
jgi:hypothetical protein